MNDQISTLPLVVWQPPWNQRMARRMAVKMRQCGHVSLRPFQQSIMRALLSGNPVVILRKGGRL